MQVLFAWILFFLDIFCMLCYFIKVHECTG